MAGVRRLSKKESDERNRVQLLEAATKCKASDLEQLVNNSPNLNTRYKERGTPLMQCAAKGSAACVKILIAAGADVNLQDNQYRTALMFAAKSKCVQCVEYLIEAKANMDVTDIEGETALIKAVTKNNLPSIKLLLEAGAKVNRFHGRVNSALMIAAMYGYTESMQLLIEAGANVNAKNWEGSSTLIMAIRKQNLKRVKRYIKDYVTNSESKFDCVQLLLEAGADANQCFSSTKVMPLSFAIYNRDVNCTKLLLKYGASIRIEYFRGIFLSVTQRKELTMHMDCLKLFYAAGADGHEAMRKLDAHAVDEDPLRLRHLTRTFIRKRLLKLNPDSNLFKVIEKLPLPSFLKSYLVYHMSLNIIHI